MGKLKSWYYDQINQQDDPDDVGPSDEDYYGSSRLNGEQDRQVTLDALIQRHQPHDTAEQVPF
jgi:hypothetical protein